MAEYKTLHDIVRAAKAKLEPGPWDYLMGASETETTLRRNRRAIDSLALRHRVLRDVREVDLSSEFLGHAQRLPVLLAPIGSLQVLHPDGALAVVRAAARFGVVMAQSSVTQPRMEETGAASTHPKIFQLYVRGERPWVAEHVRRAKDSGFVAFCLTVDTALYSRRERDLISGWVPASRRVNPHEGMEYQAALDWDTVKWFKDSFDLPLAVKGIGTAEDAAIAVEHGVDVVYVSNHGGRQLDHGIASIDSLPEVVTAVAGRARIVVDGGFYRGTDVLKAIALGADAVGIGRLTGLGLAADGEAGVLRMLEILEIEMKTSLGLAGMTRLAELSPGALRRVEPLEHPNAFASAFPYTRFDDRQY